MSYNTIIEPTADTYWSPAFRGDDFDYLFRRDSGLYIALERVPNPPNGVGDFPFRPVVFKSTDVGASWTELDPGAPAITGGGIGNLGPAFDRSFTGAENILTCFYDATRTVVGDTWTYECYVVDFDMTTLTWSAPRALLTIIEAFTLARPAAFAKRPDGKYVVIIALNDGPFMFILDGDSWSSGVNLGMGGFNNYLNLVVDADSNCHFIDGTAHYSFDPDGSPLEPAQGGDRVTLGPMKLRDGVLMRPVYHNSDTNHVEIESGSPLIGTVWTQELVADVSMNFGLATAVVVLENAAHGVDVAFDFQSFPSISATRESAGHFHRDAVDGQVLAVYWIDYDTGKDILRSAKVSGSWTSPETVLTIAGGVLDRLCSPDAWTGGGGRTRARYYVE